MAVTRLEILQHVLTILEIGKEGQNLLIDHGISSVRKLPNATDEVYQSLVDKEHSKLFTADKDQIFIFRSWYQDSSRKNSAFKEVEIMDNLTETEWYRFRNSYIDQETHTPPSHQTRSGTLSYKKEPKLKFLLKNFTTTTVKTANWPNYRREFVATLAANGQQHVIDKNFRGPDAIRDTIKYSRYKTENDLVFRGLDLGFVESILCGRLVEHIITKDGRAVYLDIDAYQRGQGPEETYATNFWNKLTSLSLTDQFTGVVEVFINQ